jgi:hypothetical protein
VKYGKSFTFVQDPVEMARYKTAATVKRRIEDYVARYGVFLLDELKYLVYDMKEFNEKWKEEVKKIREKEKEEEEEIHKKVEEIIKSSERYQQVHQD